MDKKKVIRTASCLMLCGLGMMAGCSKVNVAVDRSKDTAAISIIGGADGPTSVFIAGKVGDSRDESSGLLEDLSGNWRLAGNKTQEHLKNYGSLQEMWGSGIQFGTGMEIGADGSSRYYMGINYGGSGKVSEQEDALMAEIVPYIPEGDENVADTMESLCIIPVMEDDIQYLITPCDGEEMYWERTEPEGK